MIEYIYANKKYKEAVADKNTSGIAYKLNGRDVKIISTRSTDSLLSKIYYVFQRFFGGYRTFDLALRSSFTEKTVEDLMSIAEKYKKDRDTLAKSKAELQGEILFLNKEKSGLEAEVKACKDLISSTSGLEKQVQKLELQVTNVENTSEKMKRSKDFLHAEVQALEIKLAELNEKHWKEIQSYVVGNDPVKYLKWLTNRIKELEKVFDLLENTRSGNAGKYGDYALMQECESALRIKTRLKERIDTNEKKVKVLAQIGALKLSESTLKTLTELVELNFRLHQINHI